MGSRRFPRDDAKLTKNIRKAYPAKSGYKLEVNNKYGDVIINSWKEDSILITIVITAFGKNDDAAENLMARTDIQFNQATNGIVSFYPIG